MLNYGQLQVAVAAAKRQFGLIRKKHPELKAYLVLSLPGGQTGIDSSPAKILEEFPEMVADTATKHSALNLLEKKSQMEESLKNPSAPEFDIELKAKIKRASKLLDEFRAEFGAKLKSLSLRLNQPVFETKQYLKGLTDRELEAIAARGLVAKLTELEQAEKDAKVLEDQKRRQLAALGKQCDEMASRLEYDGQCLVELRFSDLKYDLVWKLQRDDLVDRHRTPQTKASILIVLGTLAQFERTHYEH